MMFLRKQALKLRHAAVRNANKIRVAELASTALVGNLTGTSLFTQYVQEQPFVLATVAAISFYTIKSGEITYEQKKIEIDAGRQAMVVMAFLAALEISAA